MICVKISLNFWDNTRLENMEYSSVEREMEAEALQSIYGEEIVSVKGSEENQPVSYEVNFRLILGVKTSQLTSRNDLRQSVVNQWIIRSMDQ